MRFKPKKRWLVLAVIVLLLAYCNRASLNPFAPDCQTTPEASACKKTYSAPGFEL
ncbi:hypothetical protein [Pantoea sp. 1.19]|uniref:hypothetical protein n=1 Tax=Pantoea sp. 1.19 TaxID=1925589 RepID=UPI00147A02E3|nr:hypothetical protein [Pantoea sp. 1.19]